MNEPPGNALPPKEVDPPSEGHPGGNPPGAVQAAGREILVRQAELVISYVLRGGVLLSAAIILGGIVLYYVQTFSHPGRSGASPSFPHTLGRVWQGLAQGNPQAIIVLGLLVLLATPVVRVAVSVIAFLLERDWRYVVITSLVLLILLLSFFLGKGGA
jgi:uncharacterized membrane protein